jgi:methylmalonyl-CoA mutase
MIGFLWHTLFVLCKLPLKAKCMQGSFPDFNEFSFSSKNDWMNQALKDLKGKAYEDLFWHTEEGFEIQPYYSDSDEVIVLDIPPKSYQGQANTWMIRQMLFENDLPKHALQSLQHGVQALEFQNVENAFKDGQLDKVHIEMIEINSSSSISDPKVWNFLSEEFERRGLKPEEMTGGITLDIGQQQGTTQERMDQLRHWAKCGMVFPKSRSISIDAASYAEQGANAVTELAFALSKGNASIAALVQDNLTIDDVSGKFEVRLSSGLSYFKDIAKFRAMRYLWAKLIEAYSPQHACSQLVWIHADTTAVNHNFKDPYVNLIRTTSAAMSASLGGTDSMNVKPFDYLQSENSSSGLRWARNIQHMLIEESSLDLVVDPTKGSWYVENLTAKLVQYAWELFCKLEDEGGFLECQATGMLEEIIKSNRKALVEMVQSGNRVILGVNKYPPKSDSKELKADWEKLENEIPGRLILAREMEAMKEGQQ